MSGTDHFAEAERLLNAYFKGLELLTPESMRKMTTADLDTVSSINTSALAAAQVYATLALAAATSDAQRPLRKVATA